MKIKGYIVLGLHKDGHKALGVIENSFSMGLSDEYVRVFRSFRRTTFSGGYNHQKTYNSLKRYVEMYQSSYPDYEFRVYRVGSKRIPVSIDWIHVMNSKKNKTNYNKFQMRNLRFKLKSDEKQ